MTVVANQNAAKLQKSVLMTSYPRPRLYPTRSAFVPLIDIWPTTDKMRWFSQSRIIGKLGLVVDTELQVERRELEDNVVLTFNQRHSSTLVAFRSSYWPKLHIHLEIGTVSAHKRALQSCR